MIAINASERYMNFRVILSCLLAVLYLGVFLAHDLVFLQTDFTHHGKDSKLESACRINLSPGGSEIEHNCPFCAGFIDSHVELELISRDGLSFPLTLLPDDFQQSFIHSSHNPRAPPAYKG